MAEQVDTVVIGAGVVGLACARTLAQAGRDVIVLEKAEDIGTGTSSRNSEVIHGGIYYAKDSLKALCCVEGKHMLYDYCNSHGIEHNRIGKVIVAITEDEVPKLEELKAKGAANGVNDLTWLGAAQMKEMEPNVTAAAGLLSPSTGIIESHAYMLSLQGELEERGGMIAFNTPVLGGEVLPDGRIRIRAGGAAPMELDCSLVVNSGGLYAQHIARAIEGIPADSILPAYYAKGHYFTIAGKSPFNHLIYPAPVVAASAPIRRSTWAAAPSSAPTWNGSTSPIRTRSTTAWMNAGRRASTAPSAATGRAWRTARSSPATRGCGPS